MIFKIQDCQDFPPQPKTASSPPQDPFKIASRLFRPQVLSTRYVPPRYVSILLPQGKPSPNPLGTSFLHFAR
ncbi:hypothetical protein C8Q79DRAFT_983494, partial [Trametes meyenii]